MSDKPAIQFTIIEERRPGQRPRHHIRLQWPTTYDSRREAEEAYNEIIADIRRPLRERVNVLEAELHAARAAMRGMVSRLVHDTTMTGIEARAIEAERGQREQSERAEAAIAWQTVELEAAQQSIALLRQELDDVRADRDALAKQVESAREAASSALIQGLRAELEQVRADCRRRLALLRKG